jgi:hypothetical protein
MLEFIDQSSWTKVFKKDFQKSAEKLERIGLTSDVNLTNRELFELYLMSRNPSNLNFIDLPNSYMDLTLAASRELKNRVEDLKDEYEETEFALFLQMALLGPVSLLVRSAGTASLEVSSFHGFTKLEIEKAGKSLRAKVSHHQEDPTFVYGISDVLSKYAWTTSKENLSEDMDQNGFQAIFELPKLDFDSAIDSVLVAFCEGIQNSLHEPKNFPNSAKKVRVHIYSHDGDFDRYLRSRNNILADEWNDRYSNVFINRQEVDR